VKQACESESQPAFLKNYAKAEHAWRNTKNIKSGSLDAGRLWRGLLIRIFGAKCWVTGTPLRYKNDERGAVLEVHHLFSKASFPELQCSLLNGVLIRRDIHKHFHSWCSTVYTTPQMFEEYCQIVHGKTGPYPWRLLDHQKACSSTERSFLREKRALQRTFESIARSRGHHIIRFQSLFGLYKNRNTRIIIGCAHHGTVDSHSMEPQYEVTAGNYKRNKYGLPCCVAAARRGQGYTRLISTPELEQEEKELRQRRKKNRLSLKTLTLTSFHFNLKKLYHLQNQKNIKLKNPQLNRLAKYNNPFSLSEFHLNALQNLVRMEPPRNAKNKSELIQHRHKVYVQAMESRGHFFVPEFGVTIILSPDTLITVYCSHHQQHHQTTPHNYFKSKYGLVCCSESAKPGPPCFFKETRRAEIKKTLQKDFLSNNRVFED